MTALEIGLKIAGMFSIILGILPLMIWGERKGAAYIQNRPGPNRAPIAGLTMAGLFHTIADVIKLMTKEEFIPAQANKPLLVLAPCLAMIPALMTMAVVPFGGPITVFEAPMYIQVANLDAGLLYIFAISGMGVFGIMMAGWASNNRYSLIGGLRSSAQMISYEIALGLSLVGVFMIYGTVNLNGIVEQQGELLGGFLPKWGIVVQPLAFVLFITAAFAETNRNPFDLPEGESELVAGYHTEYTACKFAMFFMAEYANIIVAAAVTVTLFFGGWQIPWLPTEKLWALFQSLGAPLFGAKIATTVVQSMAFGVKLLFFCWVFLWVRWTLPRFRYDQLMTLGWQRMLPLALANVFVTGAVTLYLRGH